MIDQQVSRLMDAYRPNPQALVQNRGVPPDLIKLLALQQLKAEKEAAMRNMQLAAAPQGEMPTVGEQLEDQVLDLTTQQVAQQVGGAAQQAQQAERQNLQRLAKSGIAAAPGAQSAAQPRAMAAGGIVAFTNGGSVSERMAELLRQGAGTIALRRQFRDLSDAEFSSALQSAMTSVRGQASPAPAAAPDTGDEAPAQAPAPRQRHALAGTSIGGGFPESSALAGPRPARSPDFEGAVGVAGLLDTPRGTAPRAAADDSAAPAVAAPAAPSSMNPELRSALERTITTGLTNTGQTPTDITAQQAALRLSQVDPEAVARRFRDEFPQLSAEEVAQQRARIDRRRAMMAEEFDPKRQGIEQLLRMGARFSRGLTPGMAAGPAAEVGLNYAAQQRAARRAMEEGILTDEEKQMEAALGGRREGSKAGLKGYEVAAPQATAGARGLVDIANAQRLAEANKLDAAVRAQASAASTAASTYGAQVQAAVSAANNAALMAERRLTAETADRATLIQLQGNLQAKLAETERKFREEQPPAVLAALARPNAPGAAAVLANYRRDLAELLAPAKSTLTRIDGLLERAISGGAPAGGGGSDADRARAELARRRLGAAEGR